MDIQELNMSIGLITFNMPLTKKGKKLKGIFIKEYGKKKGTSIFYAWEHKQKGGIRKK